MLFLMFFLLNIFEAIFFKLILPENYTNDFAALIFIFINSIVLILIILKDKIKKKKNYSNINIIIVISYVIRIIFLLWDKYCRGIFIFPNSGLDTVTFDSLARQYMRGINFTGFEYAKVLGEIYKIFYPNVLIGQFFNVVASIITIIVMKRILDLLDIQAVHKKIAMYLICFLPNYLILSAILLRESFITLFLAITIWMFLLWWKKNKFKYIILSIMSSFVAIYLHTGTIAYFLSILIIYILVNKKRIIKITPKKLIILSLFCLIFLFV